jgi:hypothetical protein
MSYGSEGQGGGSGVGGIMDQSQDGPYSYSYLNTYPNIAGGLSIGAGSTGSAACCAKPIGRCSDIVHFFTCKHERFCECGKVERKDWDQQVDEGL